MTQPTEDSQPTPAASQSEWDALAAWMRQRHSETGDLWHRALIDPALLALLGDVAGQRVLDLGCGTGYFSRRLARAGADVTAVDASAELIAGAQAQELIEPLGVTYALADAAALPMLNNASFDLVVSNMALMDIAAADAAISEVARVLLPQGRLVASLLHPCFEHGPYTGWVREEFPGSPARVWRKVSHYREVATYPTYFNDGAWQTTGYHRPLSWYMRTLRVAGLALTALEEPEPQEEMIAAHRHGANQLEIPLILIFEARKLT